MTVDNQLINKTYYKTFMEQHGNRHPVQVLGEAYMQEQQKELADLAHIRFSQGEVYFHNQDFETAIFKWENIHNELEPWAKKNMADAYFQLDLLSSAEEIYKSISTDSLILNTDVALKLFSLYLQEGKMDSAVHMIKQAVTLCPDYSNVTEIAREFFEDQQDWGNALELAVNEAVRTKEMHWFDTLIAYADNEQTKSVAPIYFSQALVTLSHIDNRRFESFASTLWNSYKHEELYFTWIKEFNRLFEQSEISRTGSWRELTALFEETYFYLLDGKYLLKEVSEIVPSLLSNWLKISNRDQVSLAAAAVLAWNEIFPSSLHSNVVYDAENLISQKGKNEYILKDSLDLFDEIVKWSDVQGLGVSPKLRWAVRKLTNLQKHYLLIAGEAGNGKDAFLQNLLGEPLPKDSEFVLFSDNETAEIREITDTVIHGFTSMAELEEETLVRQQGINRWLEIKQPSIFLREHDLAFINAISSCEESMQVADSLVFLVNENAPFTEKDRDIFMKIQKLSTDIPVKFLIIKGIDNNFSPNTENLTSIITSYFPSATCLAFSLRDSSWEKQSDLADFLKGNVNESDRQIERAAKVLYFVRKLIKSLIKKRVELENHVVETINWNEQMVMKLNGAVHQLQDVRAEKITLVQRSYRKVKEDIQVEVLNTIPKVLRECSELVSENSDFGKVHLELNKEMNSRIEAYVKTEVLPKFHQSLQAWIDDTSIELQQCQGFLSEMGEGFNSLCADDRIKLECDFRLLEDWRRDAARLTSTIHLEKINILLRLTPSQVLLKSAGKLFGVLSQNKTMLSNKYKSYLESEDYHEVAQQVAAKLLLQFELFESGLERDITMFFHDPSTFLIKTVEETKEVIRTNRELLAEMDANPEVYRDPLTLFEVRLRQYEWIAIARKEVNYI